MTIPRQQVMDLVRELPEDIEIDELIYRLYLRKKLAAAEADIAAGRGLSIDEARRAAASWRK